MKSENTHYFRQTECVCVCLCVCVKERKREISCRYLFKIASRNYCVKNPHNNRDFSIVDLSHGLCSMRTAHSRHGFGFGIAVQFLSYSFLFVLVFFVYAVQCSIVLTLLTLPIHICCCGICNCRHSFVCSFVRSELAS